MPDQGTWVIGFLIALLGIAGIYDAVRNTTVRRLTPEASRRKAEDEQAALVAAAAAVAAKPFNQFIDKVSGLIGRLVRIACGLAGALAIYIFLLAPAPPISDVPLSSLTLGMLFSWA